MTNQPTLQMGIWYDPAEPDSIKLVSDDPSVVVEVPRLTPAKRQASAAFIRLARMTMTTGQPHPSDPGGGDQL